MWEITLTFIPTFTHLLKPNNNIKENDEVPDSPLPTHLFEIAIGLTLGDLHINSNKNGKARFQLEQSLKKRRVFTPFI